MTSIAILTELKSNMDRENNQMDYNTYKYELIHSGTPAARIHPIENISHEPPAETTKRLRIQSKYLKCKNEGQKCKLSTSKAIKMQSKHFKMDK